jgi:hypothetical protein
LLVVGCWLVGFLFLLFFGSQLMHCCFTTLASSPSSPFLLLLLLLVLCFAELGVHLFGVFFFFLVISFGADIFFFGF